MPELPEVETTLRGVSPYILNKKIKKAIVRQHQLRWKIAENLSEILENQTVLKCYRRAKYLIIQLETGVLIIHLGMSGSLRIFENSQNNPNNLNNQAPEAGKHDHVDIIFINPNNSNQNNQENQDEIILRYHDPRKFGAMIWYAGVAEHHDLLRKLGVEPLESDFTADYLHDKLKNQSRPIKTALMDNAIVVGVGNIYANESLFDAKILPNRQAKQLDLTDCFNLVHSIKKILARAIETGGSTLKDFVNSDGKSGYFQQEYKVYGRDGETCLECGGLIEKSVIGQRGTFFCPTCQK